MKVEILAEPGKVYNFQVEDFHTYHIANARALVHNADNYNTGWSDDVTSSIKSQEEADLYKKAGLQESKVDGRTALIRDDIDFNSPENIARLDRKPPRSPVSKNGEVIELHHIGQNPDAPLAELTRKQHRAEGNYDILHDTFSDYVSKIDRKAFAKEKRDYWNARRCGKKP